MSRLSLIIRMICGGASVAIALWVSREISYGESGIGLNQSWLTVIGIVSILVALLLGIRVFLGKKPLLGTASFVGFVGALSLLVFGVSLLGLVNPGQFIRIK